MKYWYACTEEIDAVDYARMRWLVGAMETEGEGRQGTVVEQEEEKVDMDDDLSNLCGSEVMLSCTLSLLFPIFYRYILERYNIKKKIFLITCNVHSIKM